MMRPSSGGRPIKAIPAISPARGPILLGAACLFLLVGGFGTWSIRSEIAAAVIAPGQVAVAQNRQVVQHLTGGVVAEILVAEGDVVAEGQLLLRLDDAALRSEAAIVEGRLLEVLARRARYEAEERDAEALTFPQALRDAAGPAAADLMDGARQLWELRQVTEAQEIDQLGRRREQMVEQARGLEAQERALRVQIGIASRELETQRELLERGLAATSRGLELEREEAVLRGQVGQLAAARAEAASRVTEIDIEILRLQSARRAAAAAELRNLYAQELELSERLSELRTRMARLEVRAPVEGAIYGLDVFAPRSVVGAGDALMQIVPQERPLIIAAQVAAIDIAEVHVGQEVSIRFPGLDQGAAPEVRGRVEQISADSYVAEGGAGSFYRATITMGAGAQVGTGLLPGMPVETFIATGSQSPAAYLVAPLTDFIRRSFRGA
jgi:HlyD family type I secretion membrane fusion protein